ncbi:MULTISPECIES: hypothetical protein [Lactobacillaceae]|nr:hypothetical protein [Lactiplantibacillus plantarum]
MIDNKKLSFENKKLKKEVAKLKEKIDGYEKMELELSTTIDLLREGAIR